VSETNEELAWVCNILADTPPSTASALEEIRVKIHIRTLHCDENQDVAFTLDEYEGWNIWNEELCDKKWSEWRKVTFTISARMVCCAEVVEAWTQVMSDIRNGPLADVNWKGVLDVGFAISKQLRSTRVVVYISFFVPDWYLGDQQDAVDNADLAGEKVHNPDAQ